MDFVAISIYSKNIAVLIVINAKLLVKENKTIHKIYHKIAIEKAFVKEYN